MTTLAADREIESLMALHPKGFDLSLDRITRLLERLGNPQDRLPPVIHVAGTNGKGSCAAGASGILSNIFSNRAIVARISRRDTTMSTMPCSIRYSERWKPSGSFSRIVCSMTRGPAKPISAPGSAMWTSPSMA